VENAGQGCKLSYSVDSSGTGRLSLVDPCSASFRIPKMRAAAATRTTRVLRDFQIISISTNSHIDRRARTVNTSTAKAKIRAIVFLIRFSILALLKSQIKVSKIIKIKSIIKPCHILSLIFIRSSIQVICTINKANKNDFIIPKNPVLKTNGSENPVRARTEYQ
jgi:hypothetical protein